MEHYVLVDSSPNGDTFKYWRPRERGIYGDLLVACYRRSNPSGENLTGMLSALVLRIVLLGAALLSVGCAHLEF